MEPEDRSPADLLKISGSYWAACTLHAGVELDLFSVIGDGGLTCEQVAEGLGADVCSINCASLWLMGHTLFFET